MWQTAILGGAIVYANGNWVMAGVFVIVWTAKRRFSGQTKTPVAVSEPGSWSEAERES